MCDSFLLVHSLRKIQGLAASLTVLGLAATVAQAQTTFTVAAVQGSAYVGSGAHPTEAAVANSSHAIPSWGRTDDGSTLTIAFNAENKFKLLPNSEAEVTLGDHDSSSSWHRVVSLKIGSASLNHNEGTNPAVHLDCETPTAICGAVGTDFEVNATTGNYKVTSGHIYVHSDSEDTLKLSSVTGGSATFAPGKDNSYTHGNFSGSVVIDGKSFTASDATFTVAKEKDTKGKTAVSITSGTLGGESAGTYILEGGKLVSVESAKLTLHAQYLDAARREGALNTELRADQAAGRDTGSLAGDLASTAKEADALREKLFIRETVREVEKKTVQAAVDNATRAATEAATRAATRVGH